MGGRGQHRRKGGSGHLQVHGLRCSQEPDGHDGSQLQHGVRQQGKSGEGMQHRSFTWSTRRHASSAERDGRSRVGLLGPKRGERVGETSYQSVTVVVDAQKIDILRVCAGPDAAEVWGLAGRKHTKGGSCS